MLKAIETVYGGYRFRSRLEARYAVFLENVGARYEYEPEGFNLGDGKFYLPDFLFTIGGESFWLEIKSDSCKGEAATRANDLMTRLVHHSKRAGFLTIGTPGTKITVLYENISMPMSAIPVRRSIADLGRLPNGLMAQLAARQARFGT